MAKVIEFTQFLIENKQAALLILLVALACGFCDIPPFEG